MTVQTHDQTTQSADSYDANMIPAETAARKDREGDDFKQISSDPASAESLDTTGGETIDTEGLANNYAVEPEMYVEDPGDLADRPNGSSTPDQFTIVDIFRSTAAAEEAVPMMTALGLDAHKISILGNGYQDTEHVQGRLNWQDIARGDGLAGVLVELGIANDQALKYETEVEAGKFLVVVIGSEADIMQANQVFHAIGHKTLAEV
jgi:hypothetical protein